MNADTKDTDEWPPLSPESENITVADTEFLVACSERARYLSVTGEWQFGIPVVTYSGKWGLVWRVDFAFPGEGDGPLVNRVICWRTDDGTNINAEIAIGQRIAPLQPNFRQSASE